MIKHKYSFFAIFFLIAILFYSFAEAGKPVPPPAPSNLTASAVSTSQINLAWSDNSTNETGFKLERATSSSGPWTEIAALGANVTSYQNTGLSASTTYYYRTYAYNKTGNSSYSNTASATTQSAVTIPNAPSNLTAGAVSSSQINLSWTDNATNETGFKVERAASSSGPWSQIATTAANATTYQNTGLTASTIYYYRVRANNTAGDSSYSNTASATTQSAVTIPNAPSNLTAGAVSSSQINLSWTDNATNETGFKIERSASSIGPWSQIATTAANVTTYQNTGLTASTIYYYRVRANNTAGDSSYSNTASATTPSDLTIPNVPSGLTATAVSSSQINLSWTDNATNETGFIIYRYHTSTGWAQIAFLGVNTTSYNNTGLVPSSQYQYAVCAYNSAGSSSWSNIASATTLSGGVTIPAAPSGLTATAVSSSQINLSWTDNATNETGFKIERSASSIGPWSQIATTAANVTTYQNTGLTASTTYYYRVCANNSAGDSSYTNTANATTQSTADTTPPTGSVTINSGAAYANTTSVTLTLSASDNSGSVAQMCISNTSSCTAWETYVTSKAWILTTGDGTKTVYVWYKDAAGNANTTPYADTIVLDTTPPSSSIIINGGAAYTNTTSVTLTLSASDSLSGVSQMCISNTSSCTSWETYATSKAWTLTTGDGTKTVYAWYKDGAGNSSTSYIDTIILDMTAPPVPTGLTATAVSSSQINQSWSAVVDTSGGSGLAGYKVYRSLTQIGTTAATNYSDYGLTANTQYCYRVASYDNAGNVSGQCTQVCATTQAGAAAGGETVWADRFGGTGSDFGRAVAVDNADNVIMTGRFTGSVDFGGGALTSIGSTSLFLAKYTAAGAYLWSSRFGGASGSTNVQNMAVDGSGNIVVIGSFTGTVDFGGGQMTSAGLSDIFVAKYSSSGAHVWSKSFGYSNDDIGYGVAIDSSGNVIVTGYFAGSVNFGGGTLQTTQPWQIFLAKYAPNGAHLWSKTFSCTSANRGYGVAVDGSGNILLTGQYTGTADFGGGPLPPSSDGGPDIFVVKVSSSGTHIWSKGFGNTADDNGYDIAADGSGNVLVTGIFRYTVDFGGGPLNGGVGGDVFLAKYSANGSHLWSQRFGSSGTDQANRITVDESNNVVITGVFQGTVDFGSGPLTSVGGQDIFVAKYSGSNGYNLWSKKYGSESNDVGQGVAADSVGNVLATGYFLSAVDFGGIPLTSAGSLDIFLIQLAP